MVKIEGVCEIVVKEKKIWKARAAIETGKTKTSWRITIIYTIRMGDLNERVAVRVHVAQNLPPIPP